jgi:hypothetical protein
MTVDRTETRTPEEKLAMPGRPKLVGCHATVGCDVTFWTDTNELFCPAHASEGDLPKWISTPKDYAGELQARVATMQALDDAATRSKGKVNMTTDPSSAKGRRHDDDHPKIGGCQGPHGFEAISTEEGIMGAAVETGRKHDPLGCDLDVDHVGPCIRAADDGTQPELPQMGHPRFYEILDAIKQLHSLKAQAYEGKNAYYYNYRENGRLWMGDPSGFKYALMRAYEKMTRIHNIALDATIPTNDESVSDNLDDIAIIAIIAKILWEERNEHTRSTRD